MIGFIRGAVLGLFYLVHTAVFSMLVLLAGALACLMPYRPYRKQCQRLMVYFAQTWANIGSDVTRALIPTEWHITGLGTLDPTQSYLLIANHRSWADIMVLYQVLRSQIPFLRFFIKKELLRLPLLGWVWWALNFPAMYRYSPAYLAQHPEMKGKDIEATRTACARFRDVPITLVNFVEGTRFTPEKQALKQSTFKHLLPPKAGGMAYTLMVLGDRIDTILDITIVYSSERVSLWDLFCGRIQKITVHVDTIPLTATLMGDYAEDAAYRNYFQTWLNNLWQAKDERIEKLARWG